MFAIRSDLIQLGQRRTFGLVDPGSQIRLALTMLAITGVFLVLGLLNSYSAFAPMLDRAVAAAPEVWGQDLLAQAGLYLVVTLALAFLYAAAMIGASIAFVHRVTGPVVALRRHARSLKMGRYASRITLRNGEKLYEELAQHLNELAETLQADQQQREDREGPKRIRAA